MQNQDGLQDQQEVLICRRCLKITVPSKNNIIWDEHGYGYSTKLCKCDHCGKLHVLEYYEDCSLDINIDTRWYN